MAHTGVPFTWAAVFVLLHVCSMPLMARSQLPGTSNLSDCPTELLHCPLQTERVEFMLMAGGDSGSRFTARCRDPYELLHPHTTAADTVYTCNMSMWSSPLPSCGHRWERMWCDFDQGESGQHCVLFGSPAITVAEDVRGNTAGGFVQIPAGANLTTVPFPRENGTNTLDASTPGLSQSAAASDCRMEFWMAGSPSCLVAEILYHSAAGSNALPVAGRILLNASRHGLWSKYAMDFNQTHLSQTNRPWSSYSYRLRSQQATGCDLRIDDIQIHGNCNSLVAGYDQAVAIATSGSQLQCKPNGKLMAFGGQTSCFCDRYAYHPARQTLSCTSFLALSKGFFYCNFDDGHACGLSAEAELILQRGSRSTDNSIGDYSQQQIGFYLGPGKGSTGEFSFLRGKSGGACVIECVVSSAINYTLELTVDGHTVNGTLLPGGTPIWRRAQFHLSAVPVRSTATTQYLTFVKWTGFNIDDLVFKQCDYGVAASSQCYLQPGFDGVVHLRNNANGFTCKCRHGYMGTRCETACCAPGYQGDQCKMPCSAGQWGAGCTGACNCPTGVSCDARSGSCSCPPGVSGKLCTTPCNTTHWGAGCANACHCENGAACSRLDGSCACPDGFIGRRCEARCPQGRWGANCSSACSCKNGASCDARNGSCLCPKQFAGIECAQCATYYSGPTCSIYCHCLNNGTCVAGGRCTCRPGFQGDRCQEQCPSDQWGQDCANVCRCQNGQCDPATGRCHCPPQFTGGLCQRCSVGYFGVRCSSFCLCQNGGVCKESKRNSSSSSGGGGGSNSIRRLTCACPAGYHGASCEQRCSANSWGAGCQAQCDCVNRGKCDAELGCTCVQGFVGVHCERRVTCPEVTLPNTLVLLSHGGNGYLNVTRMRCRDGLMWASGQLTRVCQADSTWSGQVGECIDPSSNTVLCPAEEQNTTRGLFAWPLTAVGQTRRIACPVAVPGETVELASRDCRPSSLTPGTAVWGTPGLELCPFRSERTRKLNKLARSSSLQLQSSTDGSTFTMAKVAANTDSLISEQDELSVDDVLLASKLLNQISQYSDVVLTRNQTANATEVERAASAFLNVIGSVAMAPAAAVTASDNAESQSGQRQRRENDDNKALKSDVQSSMERFVNSLPLPEEGEQYTLAAENALLATVCPQGASSYRMRLAGSTNITSSSMERKDLRTMKVSVGLQQGTEDDTTNDAGLSFLLPEEAISRASREGPSLHQSKPSPYMCQRAKANFIVYNTASFFPVAPDKNETVLSQVVSVKVGGVAHLQINSSHVRMAYPLPSQHAPSLDKHLSCSFWNTTQQRWRSDGCSLESVNRSLVDGGGVARCACNHLTSFSLLVQLPSTHGSNSRSWTTSEHEAALGIVSLVGCILSATCLFATIVSISWFKELRRRLRQRMTVCLSTSLLCVMLLFIIASYAQLNTLGCRAIAMLLHYALLVSFTWMSVQAILLYRQLVIVFAAAGTSFFRNALAICTVMPAVVVALAAGTGGSSVYGFSGVCFLTSDLAYYAAFIGPMTFMMAGNAIVLVLVTYRVARSDAKHQRMNTRNRAGRTIFLLRLVVFTSTVVGSTWLIGTLSAFVDSLVLHYLFAILATTQGIGVFYFNAASSEEVRLMWKKAYSNATTSLAAYDTPSTSAASRRRSSTLPLSAGPAINNNSVPPSARSSVVWGRASISSGTAGGALAYRGTLTSQFSSTNARELHQVDSEPLPEDSVGHLDDSTAAALGIANQLSGEMDADQMSVSVISKASSILNSRKGHVTEVDAVVNMKDPARIFSPASARSRDGIAENFSARPPHTIQTVLSHPASCTSSTGGHHQLERFSSIFDSDRESNGSGKQKIFSLSDSPTRQRRDNTHVPAKKSADQLARVPRVRSVPIAPMLSNTDAKVEQQQQIVRLSSCLDAPGSGVDDDIGSTSSRDSPSNATRSSFSSEWSRCSPAVDSHSHLSYGVPL